MAQLQGWPSNQYSEDRLANAETEKIIGFCSTKARVWIFGTGEIGSAIKKFLNDSGIQERGCVASRTFGEFEKDYVENEVGLIIGVNDRYFPEIMPLVSNVCKKEDVWIAESFWRENIGRQLSEKYMEQNFFITVLIAAHCNMNCKGCLSFSPVAEEEFYSYEELAKDLSRLKEMNVPLTRIQLAGGEPFLNKDLFRAVSLAGELYPNADIRIFTNGTLLDKVKESDWEKFKSAHACLCITEYPLTKDKLKKFYEFADDRDIDYRILSYETERIFTTPKLSLHRAAPKYDYYNCFATKKSYGMTMYKGRLYRCTRATLIHHFNKRFHQNLEILDQDFLDPYNTTPEEIYKLKTSRIPFCDYCLNSEKKTFQWGISKHEIEEWI